MLKEKAGVVSSLSCFAAEAASAARCLGRSGLLSEVRVQDQDVESVNRFCYLCSLQNSDGRSGPDILRRLGIATSAMGWGGDSCVWTQKKLSLVTKPLRQAIAFYGSATWILLSTDTKWLQAFHMRCQRRYLGIRWQDRVLSPDASRILGIRWQTPQWLRHPVCLWSVSQRPRVCMGAWHMAQAVDALGIDLIAVEQCCATWSWSYGVTSLARLAIMMMMQLKHFRSEASVPLLKC